MTDDKKEKEQVIKCKVHNYIVTGWVTKGGHKHATLMRCSQCLIPVSLEELASKEWKEEQGI